MVAHSTEAEHPLAAGFRFVINICRMLVECFKKEVKSLLLDTLYASDHIEQVYFAAQGTTDKVSGPTSVNAHL